MGSRLCLGLGTVLLLGACSADNPEDRKFDAQAAKDLWRPDAPQGCPPASSLQLTLDSFPDPTCHTLQPFRGKAPGADRVVAHGGAGAAQPVTVASDGSFCIEVLLVPDSLNTITFSPVDSQGCPGQDLTRKIEHRSCEQPDGGAAVVVNVAKGATVVSESEPSKGQETYLTDGNASTVAEYSGGWGWTDANIWIGVALGQPVEVEKIVVSWDEDKSGCHYGRSYKIAVSAYSNPGQMDLNSGAWTQIEDITAGDGAEDAFSYSHPLPLAQHVALLLKKDGCNNWSEAFALREIEVWAKDPKTIPQPPADRCP